MNPADYLMIVRVTYHCICGCQMLRPEAYPAFSVTEHLQVVPDVS